MRDVIVIGAGGGGPVVAKELAARGLDVLLLEAGANDDQSTVWTHFEVDANSPTTGFQRWGPADRTQRPWRRETPQNSIILQVAGVGGTTRHYFANSPRAVPGAFLAYNGADRDAYDTAHRFPFPYRELIPYYEWVEATLPVQTAPMTTKDQLFLDGAGAVGLPVQTGKDITGAARRPQENAILQPGGNAGLITGLANPNDSNDPLAFPNATGCTFCGHCFQGCYMPVRAPRNLKAKRSTYNSYVPMALTADLWTHGKPVTLVPDSFAVRIRTENTPDGPSARAVTWRRGADGANFTEEARAFVMAAGSVESPRLWLNSGLPNPNDWVGRGMTDHFFDIVLGVFPFDTNLTRGPGSNSRADFPGRGSIEPVGPGPAITAGLGLSLSDAGMAGFYDNGLPDHSGADAAGRLVGPLLKTTMSRINRTLALLVLTDDNVEAQNRVMLSDTAPPDEHGAIPRVIMRQRARSARTLANREFIAAKAVQILRAAGASRVYRINFAPMILHVHSTMRMGVGAQDTVLTPTGEARWVKRLFIADNSALANSLGGPNPTLTTQALATRTAEKIFQICFGGRPWVGHDTPMSSIDSAVTRAVIQRGL
jgi:choline dehydrogenase-like flavoprotein